MEEVWPVQIQRIFIALSEGEVVNWDDPEDQFVKYLSAMGKIESKFPCKGGWVCFVQLNDAILGLNMDQNGSVCIEKNKIEWMDPCEELPDEHIFVLITSDTLRIQCAKWSARGGWQDDDGDRVTVDKWLKGLPNNILGNG